MNQMKTQRININMNGVEVVITEKESFLYVCVDVCMYQCIHWIKQSQTINYQMPVFSILKLTVEHKMRLDSCNQNEPTL